MMLCIIIYYPGVNYERIHIGEHIRYLKGYYVKWINLLNGPFVNDDLKRGAMVVRVKSLAEAEEILHGDPCVQRQELQGEVVQIKPIFTHLEDVVP